MTTNYRRGADRERIIVKLLERDGYTAVRSAGSRGRFDVVAWHPGDDLITPKLRLIQAKSTTIDMTRAMDQLRDYPTPEFTHVEIWNKLPKGFEIWRRNGSKWSLVGGYSTTA